MAHTASQRILFVVRRLGMGGIEQATVTLANSLIRKGHEVHLLVLKGTPELTLDPAIKVHCHDFERIARQTPKGLILHLFGRTLLKSLLPGSGFIWQGLAVTPLFDDFVREQEQQHGEFDLILIRGQGAFELIWPYRNECCWQMVEAVVGDYEDRRKQRRWLLKKLFADKQVVCVSQGVADGLSEHLAKHGIRLKMLKTIYNTVSLSQIRELAQEPITLPTDAPYLVHVARLVPEKGGRLLIEAYHKAVELGVTAQLILVGEGSERKSLEALVKQLDIEKRVHFVGRQANPYPWMAKASGLVLSSRFEALGLVLIEAQALGTQCVATDVPGGIREVLIEDQQRLIASEDVNGLAAKMKEALDDPVSVDSEWTARFSDDVIVPEIMQLISSRRHSAMDWNLMQ